MPRPQGTEKASHDRNIYDKFATLLAPAVQGRYRSSSEIADGMKRIRRLILTDGIPDIEGRPSLRPRIWKLLLRVEQLHAEDYLRYVAMGPSPATEKINHDTFRTLRTDLVFKDKVKNDMLVRVLDAFEWKGVHSGNDRQSYVQGMNALAAPFLYTMPSELEAFACFAAMMERHCPQYVQPDLRGVHRGVESLDRCLRIVDPELHAHLESKDLKATVFAFPSVLTMCACTPPLGEVLQLWDFLLAFGVHLNVLCIIAQLLLIREELMETHSPMKVLRQFPPLQARNVIGITVALVKDIPEDLYRDLVAHPLQPSSAQY